MLTLGSVTLLSTSFALAPTPTLATPPVLRLESETVQLLRMGGGVWASMTSIHAGLGGCQLDVVAQAGHNGQQVRGGWEPVDTEFSALLCGTN